MSVHSNDGNTWLTKLARIGKLSLRDPGMLFTNIGHLINATTLMEQYQQLPGNKAVSIDNMTKKMYGENLAVRIRDLMIRLHRGTYKPQASPKEDGSHRPLLTS